MKSRNYILPSILSLDYYHLLASRYHSTHKPTITSPPSSSNLFYLGPPSLSSLIAHTTITSPPSSTNLSYLGPPSLTDRIAHNTIISPPSSSLVKISYRRSTTIIYFVIVKHYDMGIALAHFKEQSNLNESNSINLEQ